MSMFLRRWFSPRPASAKAAAHVPRPFRPHLQALDDRLTPAVTFAGQQSLATGTSAQSLRAVVVADLNGDGRPDLATCNATDNSVSVLLNTTPAGAATASFTGPVPFAVGNFPISLAAGDFNGDGRTDLAAVSYNTFSNFNDVSVLLNTAAAGAGAPSFNSAQTVSVDGVASAVQVADMNGDGRTDIVGVGSRLVGSTRVTVRFNTSGTGANTLTFAGLQSFDTNGNPNASAVGDLDGDGRPDLALSSASSNVVRVLLNQTPVGGLTPVFGTRQDFSVGTNPLAVTIGDFNGDGRADLATANSGTGNVSVLRNTMAAGAGTASFAAAQNFAVGGNPPTAVSVGDFDGDGRTDLATSNANANTGAGSLSVLVNAGASGAASVAFAAPVSFTVGAGPNSAAVADFNGDGRIDVATSNRTGNNVSVLRNTTTGTVVSTPALVGQFGTTGVWGFNRTTNTWTQLTGANATALAAAPNGNVVANLGGNGVYYYRPTTGWTRINSVPATAVAIDGLGNVYASFAGIGTALYRLHNSSWGLVTSAVATKLAASANGDVVGNFPGSGVSRFKATTGWMSLSTPNADALAIGEDGTIAANFGAYGVYRFKAGTWGLINSNPATALAVGAGGSVAATFNGFGVGKYIPYANGWASLTGGGAPASIALDLYGNVFTSIPGYGTYEFNTFAGWRQRRASDASLVSVG